MSIELAYTEIDRSLRARGVDHPAYVLWGAVRSNSAVIDFAVPIGAPQREAFAFAIAACTSAGWSACGNGRMPKARSSVIAAETSSGSIQPSGGPFIRLNPTESSVQPAMMMSAPSSRSHCIAWRSASIA